MQLFDPAPVRPMKEFGSAAVLAGGRGTRMGGIDKACIRIGGTALIDLTITRLKSRFDDIIIAGGSGNRTEIPGTRTLCDLIPGCGPLSGLHSALSASESRWLWLTACDMPNFSAAWVEHLEAAICAHTSPASACVAASGGYVEPFHAFYSRDALPVLETLLQNAERQKGGSERRRLSFGTFLDLVPHIVIGEQEARRFSPTWELFFSVNVPADLDRLARSR
jgi:molybdopterin-guanine dinucleotide biosynthesis protein A